MLQAPVVPDVVLYVGFVPQYCPGVLAQLVLHVPAVLCVSAMQMVVSSHMVPSATPHAMAMPHVSLAVPHVWVPHAAAPLQQCDCAVLAALHVYWLPQVSCVVNTPFVQT